MPNQWRQRLSYLILLLLIAPGLVTTSIGEARAHGPLSVAGGVETVHQNNVQDGHVHNHEDGRHLHHESGSHFHETVDRLATGITLESTFHNDLRVSDQHGIPLRRVYRLERPPRPVIAG
ncbi:hypothetical protein GPM19_07945 [Halomonas sp. ZH2S]|uniref:Uncharacterized protein n=1 Tax=Vreelandella zhuhanensis TaxID=2684210 RepID=A0A7X3H078_9GAMM|nr:hypothetical protein [Halomonas zhuhanensis]MWJ28136.1 hypothetical protein [Halomonas zhuhanensis]